MNIRILLADDHRITSEGICSILRNEPGLEVVAEVRNGRDVLASAAQAKPDVVVMDITMPELNGIEATRQLQDLYPNIHVLILSMHSEHQFITEALAAGAAGYLMKDCPSEELIGAIRRVAAGGIHLSDAVQEHVVQGYSGGPSAAGFATRLSPREREVLQLLAEGKNTKEIAVDLHLSPKTIETHRRQVMSKLKIDSVAGLTRYALREGMTVLS